MVYFFLMSFSTIYLYAITPYTNRGNLKRRTFYMLCTPLILIYSIIGGFQYFVGSDYPSYLDIFNNDVHIERYLRTGEYLFSLFVKFLNLFIDEKQYIFLVISFMEQVLLFIIIYKLKKNKIIKREWLFIFLFFTVSSQFTDQMNAIRQSFVTYLFTISIIYLSNNEKLKFICINIVGVFIHKASIILMGTLIFLKNKWIKRKYFYVALIIVLGSFFIDMSSVFKYIISYFPKYSHYGESDYFSKLPFKQMVVKFVFLFFYFLSISLVDRISNKKNFFLKIGLILFFMKILFLQVRIFSRISYFFEIIIILPIYFLLEHWIENNKKYKFWIFILIATGIYFVKTIILPSGEYLYQSYLFSLN